MHNYRYSKKDLSLLRRKPTTVEALSTVPQAIRPCGEK